MKSYLNIVIQMMNIFIALIPNLAYPLIFGLNYHGEYLFLVAMPTLAVYTISIPFLNLLMKEMAARPGLGLGTCVKKLLWKNLILANILFVVLVFWQPSGKIILQLFFLNSAGVVSFFLAALYADNRKPRIALFLIGFVLISLVAALLVAAAGLAPDILLLVVAILNFTSAFVAILFLRERLQGQEKLKVHPLRIVHFISISGPIAMLSYGVVALAAGFLPAERLSVLRIAVSVAQAATSFFPVNQRTILENIVSMSGKAGGKAMVTRYLSAAFSLVTLMALGVSGTLLVLQLMAETGFIPRFAASAFVQYKLEILIMAPAVTLFLLASILEKTILAMLGEIRGFVYGILATILIVAGSVVSMLYFPAGGFAAYTLSSFFVVAIATILLCGVYREILKPVFLLLAVILLSSALVIWAAPGGLFAISALLIISAVSVLFISYLWRKKQNDLLNFIRL